LNEGKLSYLERHVPPPAWHRAFTVINQLNHLPLKS
jgi:hypothetical protein